MFRFFSQIRKKRRNTVVLPEDPISPRKISKEKEEKEEKGKKKEKNKKFSGPKTVFKLLSQIEKGFSL